MTHSLRLTSTYLNFSVFAVAHTAIAQKCKYQNMGDRQIFHFDISGKANLDVNNEGDFILQNLDKIEYIDISNADYISNLERVLDANIESEIHIVFPKNLVMIRPVKVNLEKRNVRFDFRPEIA